MRQKYIGLVSANGILHHVDYRVRQNNYNYTNNGVSQRLAPFFRLFLIARGSNIPITTDNNKYYGNPSGKQQH